MKQKTTPSSIEPDSPLPSMITAAQPQRTEEPGKEGDCYEGDYC